jgi:hypothetical protein
VKCRWQKKNRVKGALNKDQLVQARKGGLKTRLEWNMKN